MFTCSERFNRFFTDLTSLGRKKGMGKWVGKLMSPRIMVENEIIFTNSSKNVGGDGLGVIENHIIY